MKLKLDENIPQDVVPLFIAAGHDVATVRGQGLGGTTDERLAAVCWVERRVLITLDLDFSDVRAYPPGAFAGLVVLRPPEPRISAVVELARHLAPLLSAEDPTGRLWIVGPQGVRVRESLGPREP